MEHQRQLKSSPHKLAYMKAYMARNREHKNAYNRVYYKKRRMEDPLYSRKQDLRSAFGISLEDYNTIWESQLGACAICRRAKTESDRTFDVDHSHETGAVRGILCRDCNLGLGRFKDNPELLREAVKYLEAGV